MHIRPLTKTQPAQAANLETKLDLVNQVLLTISEIDRFLTRLAAKAR